MENKKCSKPPTRRTDCPMDPDYSRVFGDKSLHRPHFHLPNKNWSSTRIIWGKTPCLWQKRRSTGIYLANPPSLLRKAAGSAFPLDTSTRSDRPLWRLAPAPCPDQSLVKQNAANTSDVCCFHDDFTIIYRDYTCYNRETYGDTLGLCLPI